MALAWCLAGGMLCACPPPQRVVASVGSAALDVASTPGGASVFVDGASVGVTPIKIMLKPGAHRLRVALSGYLPTEQAVEVPAEGLSLQVPLVASH